MTEPAADRSAAEPPAPRLRVLVYIGSLSAGGAERQVLTVLQHLDRQRFAPELALAVRTGELLAEVPADVPIFACQDDPDRVRWYHRFGLGRLTRWWWLTRLLRQRRIEVVYDRTYLATLDAAPATWWCGVPRVSAAVADPHVQLRMYARRPKSLWRWLSRWAYRTAAVVLTNSQGLRQQMLDYWSLPPDQVRVQPNAYDFDRIDALAAEPLPEPRDDRFRILTVGRIDRDKGHADLLSAVETLVHERKMTNLLWQIIGTGPEAWTLEHAARHRGIADHVQLLGVVRNPFPYYRAADVFCLPSRSEGLPNVLIEALACGTSVIAADCPSGPREILDGGRYGELLPVHDPAAWVVAIAAAQANPSDLQADAQAGRASVRERYAVGPVLKQLETWLSKVAETGRMLCRSNVAERSWPRFVAFSLPEGVSLGGVTTWTLRMSQALLQEGWTSVLLSHKPRSGYGEPLAVDAAVLREVLHCGPADGHTLEADTRALYRSALPALFVPNFYAGPYAVCAEMSRTEASQMRVLGYCHADLAMYYDVLRHYEPMIHRFVAVSAECRATLCRWLPHRAADVIERPYAIDYPAAIVRELTRPVEPLRLLYAGRMTQLGKRIFDLVDLATELSRRGVDFHLQLIGDGCDRAELADRISQLPENARRRVSLWPAIPHVEMPLRLLESDVVVMTSDTEGTSLLLLEAMAHGCVPVVAAASGTAALVRNGETGYRCPVGSIAAMSDALEQLAQNRALLHRLGVAARDRVREFSNEQYLAWFQQLAADVWSDPPRPWPRWRPLFPPRPWRDRLAAAVPGSRTVWRSVKRCLDRAQNG